MTANPPTLTLAEGAWLDAGGIRTHYHEAGSGRPVVLLHGAGPGVSAWSNWRLAIPGLAADFHVLAPDIVGFGDTERPAGISYGVATWMQHVLDVLDAKGIERASFVGNSMGGRVGLGLAREHPDRVEKLVLMGSGGIKRPTPTPGLVALRGYTPSLDNMRELIRTYFLHDPSLAPDDLVRTRYEASIGPGVQEAFHAMFHEPGHTASNMSMPENEIAEIRVPTLLVHGREDKIVPLANSLRMLELIDDARLTVFGRCGHWTQLEQAAQFTTAVRGFLQA